MRSITVPFSNLTSRQRRTIGVSLVVVLGLAATAAVVASSAEAPVDVATHAASPTDSPSARSPRPPRSPSSTSTSTLPDVSTPTPVVPSGPDAGTDPDNDPGTDPDNGPGNETDTDVGPFDLDPTDDTGALTPGAPTTVELSHDPAAAGVADYTSLGVPSPHSSPHDIGLGYSAGPGCATNCITSGVAHVAGSGAELTVTTSVPARIWIVVWNDEHVFSEDSGSLTTEFTHDFDELFADREYSAMAVAEDAAGYTDHRYGSFETMARMAKVTFDTGLVHAVPAGTLEGWYDIDVWLDGERLSDAWDHGIAPIDIHDTVDLRIRVVAHHPHGQCVGQPPLGGPVPIGTSLQTQCFTWVVVGHWNADGTADPVNVLTDPAVVETETHRRVETTLTTAPGVDVGLDVTVGMAVEIVYV